MAHPLTLSPDSSSADMLGTTTIAVNSLHHQALGEVGHGLRAAAWPEDGVIEAVEGTLPNFIVAVQCHPETLRGAADPRWQHMFNRFVQRCVTFAKAWNTKEYANGMYEIVTRSAIQVVGMHIHTSPMAPDIAALCRNLRNACPKFAIVQKWA
jgi:hypothetical protein